MLRETICKYDFQRSTALQGRYNVETILQSFGTMSQQCCDAVSSNRVNSSSGCRFLRIRRKTCRHRPRINSTTIFSCRIGKF